jgi:hypothetical protein
MYIVPVNWDQIGMPTPAFADGQPADEF